MAPGSRRSIKREKLLIALLALCHLNKSQRLAILKAADTWLIRYICEIALNTLRGHIPLGDKTKKRLKRYAPLLRSLAAARGSWEHKKRTIVQKGGGEGFLTLLLNPVIKLLKSGEL